MCFLAKDLRKFLLVAKGTQGSGNKVYQTDPDASDSWDVLNVIIKALNILLDYSGLGFWSRWLQQKSASLQRRKQTMNFSNMPCFPQNGCVRVAGERLT